MRAPTTQGSGFSLIELLVVLMLLALALSVVPPLLFGTVSSTELKASARNVASGLRQVRGYAINQGKEAVLTLDVEQRQFFITGRERGYSLPKRLELTLLTAESELSGEGVGSIRFFPDGSSTGGRITLASGERKYIVDVDWVTGRVRIFDS
jgi:general secretion pathway protein H